MDTQYMNQDQITDKNQSLIRAIDNTGVRMFLYFPQTHTITIPENTCMAYQCRPVYTDMPDSFADDFVYIDDYEGFKAMYYEIDRGVSSASAIFHSKDLKYCHHVTLTTVNWMADGTPECALGIIENITDEMKTSALLQDLEEKLNQKALRDLEGQKAVSQIAVAIGGLYYAIYHISLQNNSFQCFRENNEELQSIIGERGVFSKTWENYVTQFVLKEYQEEMYAFGDYHTLQQRLHKEEVISHVYQRKHVGWLKAQIIVVERDEDGKAITVVMAVYDINDEIRLEDQRKEAQFEAEHDPLTRLYNRKGFERISVSREFTQNKMGFMLIDIDNFKVLNDCNGHELGDQVLVSVAEKLTEIFRNEDKIFRLGGDELAILLYNCDESAWKIICKKMQMIHVLFAKKYAGSATVTLSGGVCFSKDGFHRDLYLLADEALYTTKQSGRAGCTLINENHEIIESWSDDAISFHPEHVLEYTTSGMFRLEIPEDPKKERRIVCGDAVKTAFGVSISATPEECYRIWEKGVLPEYRATVREALEMMIGKGNAECTYLWEHPQWGKVYVRSNAFGEMKDGMIILTGIHYVLRDTNLVEKQDDLELINASMSDMFFAVYYWDLNQDFYSTIKASTYEENVKMGDKKTSEKIKEFISYVVDQHDRQKMRDFLDPETMQERMGKEPFIACDYQSITFEEKTQARLSPVKYDANGRLTHVVLLILMLGSSEAEGQYLKDYDKRSLTSLYNNVPAGIVLYEWNGKQLKTIHISDYYAREYGYTLNSEEEENKGGPDFKRVHPDDLESYQKAIQTALTTTNKLQYVYRAWSMRENRYRWVKLDAVAKPQNDGTSFVYAVYTDVTEQKIANQRMEKSNAAVLSALKSTEQYFYEYDPVKHTSTCFTEQDNGYHLDHVIEFYPECFRSTKFIHPDDVELFIETVHEIDQGAASAHCEIRVDKEGEERWHSCTFFPFYDAEKGYPIAILTVVDITLNKNLLQDYKDRLKSLFTIQQQVLSICEINLTHNTYRMLRQEDVMDAFIDETQSFETVMMSVVPSIIGEDAQNKYRELFCTENLLKQMENGNAHVEYDYLLKIAEDHYEWITAVVEMIQNPVTHEVSGVAYSKSAQQKHLASELLRNTLKQDYIVASFVIKDTDEFYLYDPKQGEISGRMQKFWERVVVAPAVKCFQEELEHMKNVFQKEKILSYLENHKEFRFAFGNYEGPYASRREICVSYADPQKTMLFATVRNISDKSLIEKWKYESEHDHMTGLLNREAVFRKCREVLESHPEEQFVMLHCDIRHFHLYNTFFGDDAGDRLLCKIAGLISNMGKDYEYGAYGRIESDVFCVFFPISPGFFENHIRHFYREIVEIRNDFLLTPAIGAYWVSNREMSMEEMFSRATIAAKSRKINLFGLISRYDEEMDRNLKETQMITNEMNKAIVEEEFEVFLQPKYSLRSEKIVGAEALARWKHPERGMLSPGVFIPVFEKNGFIADLDRYMWEHVCQILRRWSDEGRPMYPISVNISRVSMFGRETVTLLKELVETYHLDPKYLELELTETAYIDDPEDLKKMLKELQEYGFKILMDDFGSGYSSLNALRELPVDIIKLDMKFLSDLQKDKRGTAVLSSIVRMSKLLNLPIVAEGVETENQAEYLRDIGCEYVQGFLFAGPMPTAEYEKRLEETDLPEESKIPKPIVRVTEMMADQDSVANSISEAFPTALAFVEYESGGMKILRANQKFLKQFGLLEDYRPASEILKEKMDRHSHEVMMEAIKDAAKQQETIRFAVKWPGKNGVETLVCSVDYEETIDRTAYLMLAFMSLQQIRE